MALGMRLGDVTAVDAVHSLDQGEAIVSGVHAPVFLDVGSGRADDVHVHVKKAWTFSLVLDGLFRIFVVAMEVKGR